MTLAERTIVLHSHLFGDTELSGSWADEDGAVPIDAKHDVPPVIQTAPTATGWCGRLRAIVGRRLIEINHEGPDLIEVMRGLTMKYLRATDRVGVPPVADPPLHYHDRPIPEFDHLQVVRLYREIEP